jgi:hypothetical protein
MTSFAFPSDRAERTTLLTGSVPEHRRRFWELSDHVVYPDIRNIVADYINTTISDPVNTHRHGWTVSALPAGDAETNRRRLLTLTCGSVGTLSITEFTNDEDDSIELEMTVNTKVHDGYSDQQLDVATELVRASRGSHPSHEVWTWRIDIGALLTDDVEIDFEIEDEVFDDLAYALNSTAMNESSPDTADSSDDLAHDLLAEAYRQLQDAGSETR